MESKNSNLVSYEEIKEIKKLDAKYGKPNFLGGAQMTVTTPFDTTKLTALDPTLKKPSAEFRYISHLDLKLAAIASYYGEGIELSMLNEELGELLVAIGTLAKHRKDSMKVGSNNMVSQNVLKNAKVELKEEIADVFQVILELAVLFNLNERDLAGNYYTTTDRKIRKFTEEELNEILIVSGSLLQAINKYFRATGKGLDTPVSAKEAEETMKEKIAEVYQLILNLLEFFRFPLEDILSIIDRKTTRQLGRINSGLDFRKICFNWHCQNWRLSPCKKALQCEKYKVEPGE